MVTANDRFFVRNNLPMPPPRFVRNRGAWRLHLRGTRKEQSWTLNELQGLGVESLTTVLQCSGNGRKFFEHGPSGSPWGVGAAGCAVWVGLPVRLLVEAMGGLMRGARYLTSTGGEELPDGVDRNAAIVERSIPVEKALEDCLLAWEMNGEPVPLDHGGPLRLVVPGYYGCNNIKYVKRLAFTKEQTQAKIQHSGYRLRPIGRKGAPDQASMWAMNVKSWINGPGAGGEAIPPGRTHFHGVAFSGGPAIRKVEWSIDDGRTWSEAKLMGPDMGRYAWRQFTFAAELSEGTHRVFSRAHDEAGEVQPEARLENERGYGNNSWRDHGLAVVASGNAQRSSAEPSEVEPSSPPAPEAPTASGQLDPRALRGREALLQQTQPACGACHGLQEAGLQGAVGPELDALRPSAARVEAAVRNGVGAMPAYEGQLSEETIKDIAHYVEMATRGSK
ncbi:MAG: molybdopterin-dependent oxidoreductase [Myxococcota bacterium]